MRSTPRPLSPTRPPRAGFSLVEMMITIVLLAIVIAIVATVMIGSQRSKAVTEARVEAQQNARTISEILINDIRSAGYQTDENTSPNQLAFAYVDSMELILNANLGPFPDNELAPVQPQALDPAGAPLPPALDGTAYEPTVKYTTGAESIRYTLDLNGDGVVDANDQAHALATEAQRTRNPNDFVLARAVYGGNSGNVLLNNGGALEKVGIVRGPGAGVPHLFTVYLGSSATPWDWADGPIPQSQLDEISRVELNVTTESRRPGPTGEYTRTTLTSEVNSLRNSPTAGTTLYSVEGWVYNDLNRNRTRDTGEPGIEEAMIRLGTVGVASTNASGYYRVSGPPARYGLKQVAPQGYLPYDADSVTIDFLANPGDFLHSFADTARYGGWLIDTCYVDVNANDMLDPGDELVGAVTVNVAGETNHSNAFGGMATFIPPGTHAASYTAPESMLVVSANPSTIVMSNGGTLVHYVELVRGTTGTVEGYVYRDLDRDGIKDAGEPGIANVWVGVTKQSGSVTMAYSTTDTNGQYSIQVANNMPAATTPYEVTVIPPGGFYPTTTTQLSPIWVGIGETIADQNFGMSNFTQITLNADRVLSLGSGNLLEKDWTGSDAQWDTKGSNDVDLILGSEYVSNPNIAVWFNGWNPPTISTCFVATPTYTRNALSSALSIAVGPIDTAAPTIREDVVTGLARKPSGNIAVWMTQNSSSNLGYLAPPPSNLPTNYQTQNAGDANVVLLHDFGGTTATDLIVGTTGSANVGSIETWIGNGSGAFTRDEIYPPNGNLPSGTLGEVKAMAFADVTGDGYKDLIVGTKTAPGFGKVHVLGFNTRTAGDRYKHVRTFDITGEVTSLLVMNVNFDTVPDIVLGVRVTSTTGNVQLWQGFGSGTFALTSTFVAGGPVLSLGRGDFGGTTRDDIVFGFRTDETLYTGGVRILYTDLGTLPPDGVDPASGTHDFMAPAVNVNNFNYRINPTSASPYLADLAVATKTSATTGALLVFIR